MMVKKKGFGGQTSAHQTTTFCQLPAANCQPPNTFTDRGQLPAASGQPPNESGPHLVSSVTTSPADGNTATHQSHELQQYCHLASTTQ